MNNGKYILSLNNSGLCNRIKNILSVLRLSGWLSRTPIIYWVKNSSTRCEFSDLFENNIKVISDETELARIFKQERWKQCRTASNRLIEEKCDYLILNTWRLLTLPGETSPGFARNLPSAEGNDIDFEFERIPETIQKEYSRLQQTLIPIDHIAMQIEDQSRKFDRNTVSVHVRSWVDAQEWAKLFDIRKYYEIMDQMEYANFFLSCDSPEVLGKFCERYRDRLTYYPKRTFTGDRDSYKGIQDALIDVYLLAKNSKLIASFGSTFSEIAWWFGKCEAEVVLIGINESMRKTILANDRRARASLVWRNLFHKRHLKLQALRKKLVACVLK